MLSYEERSKIIQDVKKQHEAEERRRVESHLAECRKNGIFPPDPKTYPEPRCDHPNTMENSTATILWIVVMLVGSIFNDRWIIWIVATIIWLKFITRYKK